MHDDTFVRWRFLLLSPLNPLVCSSSACCLQRTCTCAPSDAPLDPVCMPLTLTQRPPLSLASPPVSCPAPARPGSRMCPAGLVAVPWARLCPLSFSPSCPSCPSVGAKTRSRPKGGTNPGAWGLRVVRVCRRGMRRETIGVRRLARPAMVCNGCLAAPARPNTTATVPHHSVMLQLCSAHGFNVPRPPHLSPSSWREQASVTCPCHDLLASPCRSVAPELVYFHPCRSSRVA